MATVQSDQEIITKMERVSNPILVRELFTSSPGETRGLALCPYFRVDSAIEVLGWDLATLKSKYDDTTYERVSTKALGLLLWIEIGFGGIENFAGSEHTRNFTTGPGHSATKEDRRIYIISEGKSDYQKALLEFKEYRAGRKDIFSENDLEWLLDRV